MLLANEANHPRVRRSVRAARRSWATVCRPPAILRRKWLRNRRRLSAMPSKLPRRVLANRSVRRVPFLRSRKDDGAIIRVIGPTSLSYAVGRNAVRQALPVAGGDRKKALLKAWWCAHSARAIEERRQLRALMRQSRILTQPAFPG